MEVDGPRSGGDEVTGQERWPYRRPVAVLLTLLLVAGVAVGAWSLTRGDSAAQQQADARPDAIAAASQFAASVNTYDVQKLSDYDARVAALLTPAFAQQFKASTQGLLAAYAKTKLTSTGTVRQAAVESIDADSAQVLVAVDATTSPAGLLTNPPRLRWEVSLVKQDGRWLVDDFNDIDAASSQTKGSGQ
jgi:Mce-associated membrane protein